MKKNTFLATACLAGLLTANAQYPTSLPNHVITGVTTVNFVYTGDEDNAEVPPWIIPGGWRSYFLVNGKETHIFSTPKSLVDNTNINFQSDGVGPYLAAEPYSYAPWKRSYNSIYSAHYYVHPSQQGISLGYLHSENKNTAKHDCSDPSVNTINPAVGINCTDHYTYSDKDQDGWKAYHALVTAAWVPNNAGTNWGQQMFSNELGPITWPSNGYLRPTQDSITSNGVGGPSSIIAGDYIYIYYLDTGTGDVQEEGRNRGIKVLRVHKNDALDVNQYRVYYKDPSGNVSWNPSLPAGFTKENMLQYVRIKGPKATNVYNLSPGTGTIRFSVAKAENTNYYIGVEEFNDANDPCSHNHPVQGGGFAPWAKHKLAIRFSYDLVEWSDRVVQFGPSDCFIYWRMRYPIFLNSNGWTNTEVNLNDFYIVGAGDVDSYVNRIRLYYYVPPPPPPPIDCPFPDIPCEQPFKGPVKPKDPKELQVSAEIFPNPVLSFAEIRFSVSKSSRVTMVLYDVNGKMLGKVEDKMYETGTFNKQLDMTSRSAGVYLLQVKIGDAMRHLKVVKH